MIFAQQNLIFNRSTHIMHAKSICEFRLALNSAIAQWEANLRGGAPIGAGGVMTPTFRGKGNGGGT